MASTFSLLSALLSIRNACDYGFGPMTICSTPRAATALVLHGADIDQYSSATRIPGLRVTLAVFAAANGDVSLLSTVVLTLGADPNAVFSLPAAIHHAVTQSANPRRVEVMEILVAGGLDIKRLNPELLRSVRFDAPLVSVIKGAWLERDAEERQRTGTVVSPWKDLHEPSYVGGTPRWS